MNQSNEKPTIKDRILRDIRSGEVVMTTKVYFRLKIAALVAVSLAVLTVSIFIFNFIYFSIRINDHEALLGFGPRGLGVFLYFFPWGLLFLDVMLVLVLQSLVRQFRAGYKIPILYLIGLLLVVATVLGFALDSTSINERLEQSGRLPPPLDGFFESAHQAPPRGSGICRCTILSIEGNTILVRDTRDATTTLRVILPVNDPHATTTSLKVGDLIYVAGEEKDGVIQAFGLHKEPDGDYDVPLPFPEP